MTIRDLTSLDECRQVVDLEREVWGEGSELVYASVLSISAKRGGILLGAFDGDALAGFVWSMPGWRDGRATQWSHMLAVRAGARRLGLGVALKIAQRARALDRPAELIEWTFDPLQAANAHLNLSVLGAVSGTYWADAYGPLDGPLHRGTPTDRLVAEWWIREPHAVRRVAAHQGRAIVARSADVIDAPAILDTARDGRWMTCASLRWPDEARRVRLPVPAEFSEMQREAPAIAGAWRRATRQAFEHAFARGYRAVDFYLDRNGGGGSYLLTRPSS